jgi:hypothetical protein
VRNVQDRRAVIYQLVRRCSSGDFVSGWPAAYWHRQVWLAKGHQLAESELAERRDREHLRERRDWALRGLCLAGARDAARIPLEDLVINCRVQDDTKHRAGSGLSTARRLTRYG